MNIICIRDCYNANNKKYVLNGVYRYYDKDYLDGISIKYYHIYDTKGNKIGCGTQEFININFLSVFEYNRVMKEIDLIFDKEFYGKK